MGRQDVFPGDGGFRQILPPRGSSLMAPFFKKSRLQAWSLLRAGRERFCCQRPSSSKTRQVPGLSLPACPFPT